MNITDRVVSKQRFFAHLRALAASKKSGTLIVTESGVERRLYFEEGAIVAATSTLREESMAYLLAERDIVKEHKVKQAEELGGKGSLLGRKLVELGALSEDEVGNAVRLRVRETISNILASPEAEITLNDQKFPAVDRVPVSIDVNQLLSAGIEASEKKPVRRDEPARREEEEKPLREAAQEEERATLEPEPEGPPEGEAGDADSQLMQALEGFTEKYSREGTAVPQTPGPVTKPYSIPSPPKASSSSQAPETAGFPVGMVAAGVVGVLLLGGGYWLLTRGEEQATSRAGRSEAPVEPAASTARTQPTQAEAPPAETATDQPTPEVSASLTAPPRPASAPAPSRPSPASSPPPQPVQSPPAAAVPQPAPSPSPPRQQSTPEPPAAPPSDPAPVSPEPVPEPEPPPSPAVAETEPTSQPPPEASAPPSAQPAAQPEPDPPASGNWGSAIFAPKQATVSSAPTDPGVQTGDLVEPGFDVIDPVLIEHPELEYPDEAKRQRIPEAVVRVRVLVDHTGAVQDAEVEKGAGHGFDEVALAAALQARFIPATKDQVQVKVWTVLPLVFRLDD